MKKPSSKSIIIIIALILLPFYVRHWMKQYGLLWDLSTYTRVVLDYQNGFLPYRTDLNLNFIYHPLVLQSFYYINEFFSLTAFLLLFYTISLVWFSYEINAFILSKENTNKQITRNDIIFYSTVTVVFGGIGVCSLLAGNITPFLHFYLIASFLRVLRKQDIFSIILSFFFILIFSVIKPYFLLYILIPFLINYDKRKLCTLSSVMVLILWITIFGCYYFINNEEFTQFWVALKHQSIHKNDVGYSFYGILRNDLGLIFFEGVSKNILNDLVNLMIHISISCILLFWFKSRIIKKDLQNLITTNFFLAYFVLTIINPRLKEYDVFPATICLFIYFNTKSYANYKILLTGLLISSIQLILKDILQLKIDFPSGILRKEYFYQIIGLIVIGLGYYFSNLINRKKIKDNQGFQNSD